MDLRLGFACAWTRPRERTWSHIPSQLQRALSRTTSVTDMPSEPPWLLQRLVNRLTRRLFAPGDDWRSLTIYEHVVAARLRGTARIRNVDAVLEIGDLAGLPLPHFFYQDLSYDLLMSALDEHGASMLGYPNLQREALVRRRDRQRRLYAGVTAVFAMSDWLATDLVRSSSVAASRVAVVHAGSTAVTQPGGPLRSQLPRRRRLLFLGRHFFRKGGDAVVRAVEILRRDFDPTLTLTVVGPPHWPLDSEPPDGVAFLGDVSSYDLVPVLDSHDLLVLPSRFEPFGIAFVEALARGMPCIGRSAYAMPELISPGENGALVSLIDPDEIASAAAACLEDSDLYRRCEAARQDVLQRFSWGAVAERIVTGVAARL